MLPTSGCQLQLQEGTITYKVKRELKHARTAPLLRQRLCHKHAWTDSAFEDINWNSFGKSLRRHDKQRVTMVKYLNCCLPVGTLVNKYDKKYPINCPSCSASIEDNEHLHRCPATSRIQWRKTCYTTMRKKLEQLKTPQHVQSLFLEGLQVMLQGQSATTIQIPLETTELAQSQRQIGWHHILKGKLSNAWDDWNPQQEGTSWTTEIIDTIFTEWWKLWELRNEDRHGRDQHSRMATERAKATHEVGAMYALAAEVPELQWIVDTPVQEITGYVYVNNIYGVV